MNESISNINPILTIDYIQNHKENQYFDRKSSRKEPKEISKHLIAFANASGGVLVVGVEDDGTKAQTGQRINLIKDINIDGPIPKVIDEAKLLTSK